MDKLCECGCGLKVNPGCRFVSHHEQIGRIRRPSTRRKMRLAALGKIKSEDHRKNLSFAHLGKVHSSEHTDRQRQGTRLYWEDPENRKRVSHRMRLYWSKSESRDRKSQEMKLLYEDPEYREMQSQAHKLPSKLMWKNPNYRNRVVSAIIKGNQTKPTKPELRLMEIIEDCDLPFIYNGNQGSLIVDGFCPDFISWGGYRCLIEVYGDYWHQNDTRNIEEIYRKHGYKTLILWEHEILREPEDYIMFLILDLLMNKVKEVPNPRQEMGM